MPKINDYRRIRVAMWNTDPRCCWCERKTFLIAQKDHETANPLMATIEHIHSRQSHVPRRPHSKKALSCYTCNTLRNRMETAMLNEMGLSKFDALVEYEFNQAFKKKMIALYDKI